MNNIFFDLLKGYERQNCFSLLSQSLLREAFLVIRLTDNCKLSRRASGGCHRAAVSLMIVKISRRGTSRLFWGCSLKELTTAKGDNACAWQ